MRTPIEILILAILTGWSCQSNDQISFSSQVKPILNEKCLSCHGGIEKQGGLSLLFEEETLGAGESGQIAIVPGKPGQSEVMKRITLHDPELRMPQEDDPLSQEEIDLIEAWIRQGAHWDKHWAYAPLDDQATAAIDSWSKRPMDEFVLNKLAALELTPNTAAKPATLARRVSLDILGIPSSANKTSTFVQDPSEERYVAMVDTLLNSPHYGERMASMWLDLARYADSKGYEKDAHRDIWRYRDWVIEAFNTDLSFDQFTTLQLAADLLPDVSEEDLIATAFHRNTMTNDEGGTEDEEYRSAAVVDRVNTTFEIWQGTTMGCVQCHSHPYDPIRHEEYYKLYAIFNGTQDADLGNEFPYLIEPIDEVAENKLHQIADYINTLRGLPKQESAKIELADIRRLVFPRLQGDLADDFQEIQIRSNGTFSNGAMNANNQKNKEFFLLFEDITLDGLSSIIFRYQAAGDDVLAKVRLGNRTGSVIAEKALSRTSKGKGFSDVEAQVVPSTGQQDLLLELINTSGEVSTGVAFFKELELVYDDQPLGDKLYAAQDSLLRLYRRGIKTPIMRRKSSALNREHRIHERGNYLVKGEVVAPGVPESLSSGQTEVTDRLELARWLTGPDNALTARVIVNRIWALFFGHGLVPTLEDFGSQGEDPSHPQLLDHLAQRFAGEWQWSTKRLVKEIVCSATYRQSSVTTTDKLAKDPYNRWYSRGARARLSAEQIRDQALVVSGLFADKVGGKSVMPPQPDDVWQVVYSNEKWIEAEGDDRFRRGLYTYWKRTTPYPSMVAFDSPSREFCVSRRIPTNTPLQALVTLNDTVYLEAAQALAKWMLANGDEVEEQIRQGFAHAIGKVPDDEILDVLLELHREMAANFQLKVGESVDVNLKPMTIVASAIMNLDEFLTKT